MELTHWCHVTLVVHETGIEVGSVVGGRAGDEGLTTREGILQEVEHGEELVKGQQKSSPSGNQPKHTLPGGIIMWSPNQPAMTE